MKRYSSKGHKTLALGTIAALGVATTGCEAPVQQPAPLPNTPVQFSSPTECVSAGYEPIACQDAYQAAMVEHEKNAPRYNVQNSCETEWGTGNCKEIRNDSGSFFMPFIAGYLVSSALSSNNSGNYSYGGYYGSPIYRSRNGPVQLSGSPSTGVAGSPAKVQTKAVTAPKPANVNTRSVSRGGFGGRMGGRSMGG